MNIDTAAKLPTDIERERVEPIAKKSSAQSVVADAVAAQNKKTQDENQAKQKVDEAKEARRVALESTDIASVIEELNKAIPIQAHQLQFSIHEGTNQTVVSMIDKESGELIRQLPSEEALELAARLREAAEGFEQAIGVLVNSKI